VLRRPEQARPLRERTEPESGANSPRLLHSAALKLLLLELLRRRERVRGNASVTHWWNCGPRCGRGRENYLLGDIQQGLFDAMASIGMNQ
jgi:hypothetical protein